MIELIVGNVGSGKTATAVKEIVLRRDGRACYSNIKTIGVKHNHLIKQDMILKVVPKLDTDGNPTNKTEIKLNVEFWLSLREKHPEGINVYIDEAHSIYNSRRSMSKQNIIMGDFLALIRKILTSSTGKGKLTLITQLPNRIDKIARDMCTLVKYFRCHYIKTCKKCNEIFHENNETVEKLFWCPNCGSSKLKESNHKIEAFHFSSVDKYEQFIHFGVKSYHRRYLVNDLPDYFGKYDTLQINDLVTEF